MNIDNLTYGEIKAIAAMFAGNTTVSEPAKSHEAIPVIVCTDKRGVVFGYCADTSARPIKLTSARMCIYWSADVGGVFGLGEKGPTKDCKVSATLPELIIEGVTAIFSVDPIAEKAWNTAKVQGR
jgi:hypothetical protein